MRISVVVLLAFCGGFIACQNYDLQDRISCPGCAAEGKAAAQYTPCTNCRIFISGSTLGDMSGDGSCGGVGGGTAVCGVGANGIQKADYICQNDPNRPGTKSQWKALISDSINRKACINPNCSPNVGSPAIDWILRANTTYYRADGATVIMNTDANGIFVFGTLSSSISASTTLWTGLVSNWTYNIGNRCDDWTSGTGAASGGTGDAGATGATAIQSVNDICSLAHPLYCVEQ